MHEKVLSKIKASITLSSGRTIEHYVMPNGSCDAIPTYGSYAMTEQEAKEYLIAAGCNV